MKWTKVIEEDTSTLPIVGIEVLIYSEEGYMSVERRRKGEDYIYADSTDSGLATHWMYLPPPPKR